MKSSVFVGSVLFIFLFLSTGKGHASEIQSVISEKSAAEFLLLSKEASLQAKVAGNSRDKRRIARSGVLYAEKCLQKNPNDAPCLYYHGVNLGIELDTRIFSVKKDLLKMISDFERVIALDDRYDFGGAYQALGYVYILLPPLPILGTRLQRDIDKAEGYARQALAIAPHDPGNLKLAGEIALKRKNHADAARYFHEAFEASLKIKSPNADELKLREEIRELTRDFNLVNLPP